MPIIQMSDFKKGLVIRVNGEPMVILSYSQAVQGRGASVTKARLRNITTGAVREMAFKGGDKFEEVEVVRQKGQFLYASGDTFSFMDSETYDQHEFTRDQLGDSVNFLIDGMDVHIMMVDGQPAGILLPPKVVLKVISAPPGVKGDTAQGGSKPVEVETGYKLNVPLFVNAGDSIRINTESGEYVERA